MKNAVLVMIVSCFMYPISLKAQEVKPSDSLSQVIVETKPVERNDFVPGYRVKNAIDIPLTIAGDAWSLYGMSRIYGRDSIPAAEILALDRRNINKLDRPVSYNYSEKAAKVSDYFFYGSMPLPLILLADKRVRKDAPKVGLLYLEAVGITGSIYVTSAMLANRHRPYSYNEKTPMSKRTRGGVYNSFFAGHVAVVATSVFYTAQTYITYHPEMKNKWILYAGAGAIATFTGAMRIAAGQHFYTDVATGLAVGTLSGILTPYLHRKKIIRDSRLTLLPNIRQASTGFTMLYNLDKKR